MQPKIGDIAQVGPGFVASIGGRGAGVPRRPRPRRHRDGIRPVRRSRQPCCLRRLAGAGRGPTSPCCPPRPSVPSRRAWWGSLSFRQSSSASAFWSRQFLGGRAGDVLALGIAQVPAVLVTLPAVGWIWWRATRHGRGHRLHHAALLAGMTDNVLKPLVLGRGVDAPMPIILLGALGGMATAGSRHVRRRDPPRARLPALHWVGGGSQGRCGRSPEDRCQCEWLSV